MEVNSILLCGGIAIFTLILQKLASGEGLKDFFLKNETEKQVSKEEYKEVKLEEQAAKLQEEKINKAIEKIKQELKESREENNIGQIKQNIDSDWENI